MHHIYIYKSPAHIYIFTDAHTIIYFNIYIYRCFVYVYIYVYISCIMGFINIYDIKKNTCTTTMITSYTYFTQ